MTTTKLRELIVNGENSHVEFKRDEIENHKLAKELVAFANLGGGCVLLGVDRDGSVHGLARQDPRANTEDDEQGGRTYQHLEEWVMQACRDKIRPEIIPYFEIFRDVEPGRDVAAVQVARGWSVHHVWHNQRRTYCIRVGSLSREASPEELARLFQQRGAFRSELRPVSGTSNRGSGSPPPRGLLHADPSAGHACIDAVGPMAKGNGCVGAGPGPGTLEVAGRLQGTGVACGAGGGLGFASRQHRGPRRRRPAAGDRCRAAAVRQQSQPIPSPGEDRCGRLFGDREGL